MQRCIKSLVLLSVLAAALGSPLVAGKASAQTLKVLHSFSSSGIEGGGPNGRCVLSNNILYGTTVSGGSSSRGTVFKVNTDGTGFETLYNFTTVSGPDSTNRDGATPRDLILSGNTLYGTTLDGGNGDGLGTLFAMNTDGSGFTNLHSFTKGAYTSSSFISYSNYDGALPEALTISGNRLYAVTYSGGIWGNGAVSRINTDGEGFTNLYSFSTTPDFPPNTNSDGANPEGGLIVSGDTLYGTTLAGGSSAVGTVFAMNMDGTDFATLHSFSDLSFSTNNDGAYPGAGLILSGDTLYGTAERGGSSGSGTVFAIKTDGTGFSTLHEFTALSKTFPSTNSDGVDPEGGLVLSGDTLYGTTLEGGPSAAGTVFAIRTDGTHFRTIYSFTNGFDGANPSGGLILSGHALYGTALLGGGGENGQSGTVFSLSFTPQLTIIPSTTNFILTWPTDYAGFDYSGYRLQSTMDLGSPVWTTNLPTPVIINGQNTVTNPISAVQQFFRLSQ